MLSLSQMTSPEMFCIESYVFRLWYLGVLFGHLLACLGCQFLQFGLACNHCKSVNNHKHKVEGLPPEAHAALYRP